MSRAEIGAGREMDALIAERVMKIAPRAWDEGTRCPECGDKMRWCGERSRCTTCSEWRYGPYREYSTEIAAAWEVVEQMQQRGYVFSVWCRNDEQTALYHGRWGADFERETPFSFPVKASAETPAEAICRAALAAVEAP